MIFGDDDLVSRDAQGNLKPLSDGQFDINGFTFGGWFDAIVLDKLDPGEAPWEVQDHKNPFGSETFFGADRQYGPTLTFNAYTNGASLADSLNWVEVMSDVWWDHRNKLTPGYRQILRYNLGGKTRRVYGRGRKFVHSMDNATYAGTAPITMTFDMVSNHYYDDDQRSVTISVVPGTTGGLEAPLVAPLTAIQMGEGRGGQISEVGGTAPAPFHLYIEGPIQNPYVEQPEIYDAWRGIRVPGWRIQLNTIIREGQTAHISTYPGGLVVEDQNGAHIPMSFDTRLNDARLYPGAASLNFSGIDSTGTSRATIVWRPTHTSL